MMSNPQIGFHGFDPSDAVRRRIWSKIDDLEKLFRDIISCRIALEKLHARHQQGNKYHVRIALHVPGADIVVGRSPELNGAHEDLYVAIRDAFRAAERQLSDYVRQRRPALHNSRGTAAAPHGWITRIHHENEGYGFLETEDGREIYFNSRSVLDHGFDDLQAGDEVRFTEEYGDEGPQASTVEIVGKHGRHVA